MKVEAKPKKKKLKYNYCGCNNHDNDHCFQLHPELRPASYVSTKSQREKTFEAKVVEF